MQKVSRFQNNAFATAPLLLSYFNRIAQQRKYFSGQYGSTVTIYHNIDSRLIVTQITRILHLDVLGRIAFIGDENFIYTKCNCSIALQTLFIKLVQVLSPQFLGKNGNGRPDCNFALHHNLTP